VDQRCVERTRVLMAENGEISTGFCCYAASTATARLCLLPPPPMPTAHETRHHALPAVFHAHGRAPWLAPGVLHATCCAIFGT